MSLETTQASPAPPEVGGNYVALPRQQPGERTPLNAHVAFPGQLRRGPGDAMPGKGDLISHLLRHDTMHAVVRLTVGHCDAWSLEVTHAGKPVAAFDDPKVAWTWRRGYLDEPRHVLAALSKDCPVLREHTLALVVVRDSEAQRSLGLGFAVDAPDLGCVLWDLEGWEVERKEAALLRRYGGQDAREEITVQRQWRMKVHESELPLPETRFQAIRAALEYALRRDISWWLPPNILDLLPDDLRSVVESNLELLWDSELDEPRDSLVDVPDGDVEHLCLTRWLGPYQ